MGKSFVEPTSRKYYKIFKSGWLCYDKYKNINKKETCYDDFFNAF